MIQKQLLTLLLIGVWGLGTCVAQNNKVAIFIELDGGERITFDSGLHWTTKNASHQPENVIFESLDGTTKYSNDQGMTWRKTTEATPEVVEELEDLLLISNPVTNGILTIKSSVPESTGELNLTLHDLQGRTILQKNGLFLQEGPISLEVAHLKPGIYFIHAVASGREMTTKVLVQ